MSGNIRLAIFHTNDMHARLEAMVRLSSYCRRLRAEAQEEGMWTEFWDAGDAADRRLRICSLTKGAAFAPILNAMGYTLQTMGNAISLPYGPQAITEVVDRAAFPILAANCRDGQGPLTKGLQEYALIPLEGGITMGVIGLTAPWGGMYEIFGLRFPDYFALASSLVQLLKDQDVAPICVLSHLGLADDRSLAERVPGIDLIVGGHSHDELPSGERLGETLIAQAGSFGKALGLVEMELERGSGRVLACSARLLTVPEDEPPDPAIQEAIRFAEDELQAVMAEPIGVLRGDLDLDHFRECSLGNLVADALRHRMGAEIAMLASGQLSEPLIAGTTTLGQLDAACFSSANPGVTEVSGGQILEALERGLDPHISHFEHHGLRGTPFGIPQISGLKVYLNPDPQEGRRISAVFVGEQQLEPERLYRLAHTDAETIEDHGYLILQEGQATEYEVPTIVREVLQDYIREHSPIVPPANERWVARR